MSGFLALRVGDINIVGAPLIIGSFNVLVNNRPAGRVGDINIPHPGQNPKKPHPPNPVIIGSTKVLVNNRPYGRQTSLEVLLHPYITGSTNVIVGL